MDTTVILHFQRHPTPRRGLAALLAASLAGLLLALAPVQPQAPLGFQLAVAMADDDDGGGRNGGRNDRGNARDDRSDLPRLTLPSLSRLFGLSEQRPRPSRPAPVLIAEPDVIIATGVPEDRLGAIDDAGFRELERYRLNASGQDLFRFAVPQNLTAEAGREAFAALVPGATVDINHFYTPEAAACRGADCDPRDLTGWPAGPARQACGPAGRIGMVDTAINADHPALANARILSLSVHREDVDPSARQHGTAVAALLVGQGEIDGLLAGWELVAADPYRKGDIADGFSLIKALDLLVAAEVRVINLSLAGPSNALVAEMIGQVAGKGVVLIAAAGNDGPRAAPAHPAALADVLAVTAIDARLRAWRRAAQGAHVDLAAPGVQIWSAASIKGRKTFTGTSFAAPFVSAAAALIDRRYPGLSGDEIRQMLEARARDLGAPGRDSVYGWGLIDAAGLCAERASTDATGTGRDMARWSG